MPPLPPPLLDWNPSRLELELSAVWVGVGVAVGFGVGVEVGFLVGVGLTVGVGEGSGVGVGAGVVVGVGVDWAPRKNCREAIPPRPRTAKTSTPKRTSFQGNVLLFVGAEEIGAEVCSPSILLVV